MKQLAAALVFLFAVATGPAMADQGSLCMPTTGTVSGLSFAQDVNAGLQALISANNGATAPANACALAPVLGQVWLDTSTAPNGLKQWDGAAWEVEGYLDAATGRFTPPIGGGADSLASAATTDLWSKRQAYLTVSGTTGITSFGGASGVVGSLKFVVFSGSLTLTYNASSLILPTAANITTQAGDSATVVNLGGGNVRVINYTRADGSALTASSLSGSIVFSGVISPASISGTTNNWAPSGLATASIVRANAASNAVVTGLSTGASNAWLVLQNINAATSITLNDADTNSTAANRFAFGANYVLGPEAAVQLRYDSTLSRWVIASGPLPASTAQATTGTDTTTFMTPLRTAQAIAALAPATPVSNQQVFTTAGAATWTKPGSGHEALAQCWGAGGGGSIRNATGKGGGGGGGGAYAEAFFLLSSLSATETVTVGAGGPSVTTDTVGNPGGNSSFGSHLIAYGGGGGGSASGSNAVAGGGGGGQGSAGGTASGNTPGTAGTDLVGGTSVGSGALGGVSNSAGAAALYGGGGGAGGGQSDAVPGQGGNSGWGGAGGGAGSGANNSSAGGTSVYGGNGGAGSGNIAASPGSQPGGGGGGQGTVPSASGKGGDGKCIITTF